MTPRWITYMALLAEHGDKCFSIFFSTMSLFCTKDSHLSIGMWPSAKMQVGLEIVGWVLRARAGIMGSVRKGILAMEIALLVGFLVMVFKVRLGTGTMQWVFRVNVGVCGMVRIWIRVMVVKVRVDFLVMVGFV